MATAAERATGPADDDDAGWADLFQEPEGFRPATPPPTARRLPRVRTARPLEPTELDAFELRLVGHHSLWAHCLWNAGVILARHFDDRPDLVAGKRVLELGAAAAVPSMVAALNGAAKAPSEQAVITDYPDPELIENIVHNVDTNLPGYRAAGRVAVLGYRWGQPTAPLLEALSDGAPAADAFDLIILADVVFNHNQHQQLLQTCDACLTRDGTGEIYVPFTPHRPWLLDKDLTFFRLAEAAPYNFVVDQPFQVKTDPMFPDDPGDLELRSTVFGYRLRRAPAAATT